MSFHVTFYGMFWTAFLSNHLEAVAFVNFGVTDLFVGSCEPEARSPKAQEGGEQRLSPDFPRTLPLVAHSAMYSSFDFDNSTIFLRETIIFRSAA